MRLRNVEGARGTKGSAPRTPPATARALADVAILYAGHHMLKDEPEPAAAAAAAAAGGPLPPAVSIPLAGAVSVPVPVPASQALEKRSGSYGDNSTSAGTNDSTTGPMDGSGRPRTAGAAVQAEEDPADSTGSLSTAVGPFPARTTPAASAQHTPQHAGPLPYSPFARGHVVVSGGGRPPHSPLVGVPVPSSPLAAGGRGGLDEPVDEARRSGDASVGVGDGTGLTVSPRDVSSPALPLRWPAVAPRNQHHSPECDSAGRLGVSGSIPSALLPYFPAECVDGEVQQQQQQQQQGEEEDGNPHGRVRGPVGEALEALVNDEACGSTGADGGAYADAGGTGTAAATCAAAGAAPSGSSEHVAITLEPSVHVHDDRPRPGSVSAPPDTNGDRASWGSNCSNSHTVSAGTPVRPTHIAAPTTRGPDTPQAQPPRPSPAASRQPHPHLKPVKPPTTHRTPRTVPTSLTLSRAHPPTSTSRHGLASIPTLLRNLGSIRLPSNFSTASAPLPRPPEPPQPQVLFQAVPTALLCRLALCAPLRSKRVLQLGSLAAPTGCVTIAFMKVREDGASGGTCGSKQSTLTACVFHWYRMDFKRALAMPCYG